MLLPPSPMMMGQMGHHSPFAGPRISPSACPMMPLSIASAQQTQQVGLSANNSVRFIQRLGAGAFGEVWKAEYRGKEVAAKVTGCPVGFRPHEISILRAAQGSHTVKFIAEERNTSKGTAIIMELCEGSLSEQMNHESHGKSAALFLDRLADICEALKSLHERQIVFGDLKPDNILVNKEGGLVFSDFGDARDGRSAQCSPQDLGWGCPNYHAKPDVEKREMTPASDVWMFAQTAIHMWTRESAACNPSPLPQSIPLRGFLQRCFSTDPSLRPTAERLLREIKWAAQKASKQTQSESLQTRSRGESLAFDRSENIPLRGQAIWGRRAPVQEEEPVMMSQSAPSAMRLQSAPLASMSTGKEGMDELMMRVKLSRKIKKTR